MRRLLLLFLLIIAAPATAQLVPQASLGDLAATPLVRVNISETLRTPPDEASLTVGTQAKAPTATAAAAANKAKTEKLLATIRAQGIRERDIQTQAEGDCTMAYQLELGGIQALAIRCGDTGSRDYPIGKGLAIAKGLARQVSRRRLQLEQPWIRQVHYYRDFFSGYTRQLKPLPMRIMDCEDAVCKPCAGALDHLD